MRIILEVDENDIHHVFEDCWLNDQLPPSKLESIHFKDIVREYWKNASEVWFKTRISNFKIQIK